MKALDVDVVIRSLILVCLWSGVCHGFKSIIDPSSPYLTVSGGRTTSIQCSAGQRDCFVQYDWPCVTVSVIISNISTTAAAAASSRAVALVDMYGGGNYFQVDISQWNQTDQSWTLQQSTVLQTDAFLRKQYPVDISTITATSTDHLLKIEVIKRTEASGYMIPFPPVMVLNPVKFYSFIFTDESATLHFPPSPTSSRKIEMFSDSDSNGFGIEGAPQSICLESLAKYEACNKGYPRLVADALNAELHVQGWSGKGVVRGAYDLLPNPQSRAMPLLWNHTLATSSDNVAEAWNFTSWIPDVVIVSLGSNDFTNLASFYPSNETFIAEYVKMLERIRASYPDQDKTKLVVVNGGYPYDVYNMVSALSNAAVAEYNNGAQGDTVNVIDIPERQLNKYPENYGCLDHRNVQGQINVANYLVPRLKSILNW
eukprot:TRINITY_DN2536_c0_g1_i1.p1 TRINITY_DN2536_c0_g1~~TRINITY_DN2536_c0_g1_i1.p1  ORF type:complete len:427 (-),score=104.01 TRINITY_DN2536_c0_g1_i1:30-1310(-)